MRAGSSLTGELLSLSPEVNYLFEPLWLQPEAQSVIDELTRISRRYIWNQLEGQLSAAQYLTSLLRCNLMTTAPLVAESFHNTIRFNLTECWRRPMVLKVIRLHGRAVHQVLEFNPELKLVHLVRDPRGLSASRQLVGAKAPPMQVCDEIRQDLPLADELLGISPERYTSVRYEDLVNPKTRLSELARLYHFMGVPLPKPQLDDFLDSHYGDKPSAGDKFKTYRKSSFDPNSWKHQLSTEEIREADAACADIMERFHYEPGL